MTSLPISAPTYARDYRISAKTALETALSSVPAYQTWRRYDRPSADIFARYQAMPVLTKADLRAHQPAEFVPQGRDLAAALARGEVELVMTSGSPRTPSPMSGARSGGTRPKPPRGNCMRPRHRRDWAPTVRRFSPARGAWGLPVRSELSAWRSARSWHYLFLERKGRSGGMERDVL